MLQTIIRVVLLLVDGFRRALTFIADYGQLPEGMNESDICLTSGCSKSIHYDENQDNAEKADVIITSHAMLICDALFHGKLIPGSGSIDTDECERFIVIDEADQLIELYEELSQRRLNLYRIKSKIFDQASNNLKNEIRSIISDLKEYGEENGHPHFDSNIPASRFVRLKRLARLGRKKSKVLAQFCDDIESILDAPYSGPVGVGFSHKRQEPSIVKLSPWISKSFSQYIKRYDYTLMTSATLSLTNDLTGFDWFSRGLGITKDQILSQQIYSPSSYGYMRIHHISPSAPPPFVKQDKPEAGNLAINQNWLDTVSKLIASNIDEKTSVVLTGSFSETNELCRRLNKLTDIPIVCHKAGQKIVECIDAFKANGGLLLTPSGASGMDIRGDDGGQFFSNLFITRIPFRTIDNDQVQALSQYFSNQFGKDKLQFSGTLYRQEVGRACRIMRQKIGRGIRSPEDDIDLFLLDPRFPCHSQPGKYKFLENAIPKRFFKAYINSKEISTERETLLSKQTEMEVAVWSGQKHDHFLISCCQGF